MQTPDSRESGGVRDLPDLAARCRAARTLLLIARGSAESEPLVSAALALLDSALGSFDTPPPAATEEVMDPLVKNIDSASDQRP